MNNDSSQSLRQKLSTLDVDNVYIYVGDAVRRDFLPGSIANRGLSVTCVTGSIHTPTSFATIVSGHHFPTHGVADFKTPLPENLPNLFDTGKPTSVFINSINSKLFNSDPHSDGILSSVLGVSEAPLETIESASEPFLILERGPGGHAPYGDFDGNGWEYFEQRGASDPSRYVQEYKQSVADDAEWFRGRVETLRRRGVLDDTLMIYTSDHGELLGENGLVGHNGPIARPLVDVPCVFIHPSIEPATHYGDVVRHVDITPTVAAVMNGYSKEGVEQWPGRDLSSEGPADTAPSYYAPEYPVPGFSNRSVTLSYRSLWDSTGGHVFAKSRLPIRFGALTKQMVSSPSRAFLRRYWKKNIPRYAQGCYREGAPEFSQDEARRLLNDLEGQDQVKRGTLQVNEERLRELGYLE